VYRVMYFPYPSRESITITITVSSLKIETNIIYIINAGSCLETNENLIMEKKQKSIMGK
jgi:hypothetical protein